MPSFTLQKISFCKTTIRCQTLSHNILRNLLVINAIIIADIKRQQPVLSASVKKQESYTDRKSYGTKEQRLTHAPLFFHILTDVQNDKFIYLSKNKV